jgi:hypothetical protein
MAVLHQHVALLPSLALHAGYSRILRSPLRGASRSHHDNVEMAGRAELSRGLSS